jgi:hypothetical protein
MYYCIHCSYISSEEGECPHCNVPLVKDEDELEEEDFDNFSSDYESDFYEE